MKRILVLDNSDAVRETVALILERDFIVEKRAAGTLRHALADIGGEFDMVVYGAPPEARGQWTSLMSAAQRSPCPVLLIVDSQTAPAAIGAAERIGYMTIPFDPYRLRAEVERLATASNQAAALQAFSAAKRARAARYGEFPFVSRITASLVQKFAASGLPVLISGETGCGQERVARAMAAFPENPDARLTLSAAGVNEEYLAQRVQTLNRHGPAGEAALTLTIHGIEHLTSAGQELLAAFLDELEEKSPYYHVYATAHGDLLQKVYSRQYSEALYYRLATLTVNLEPLRERRGDIAPIAERLAEMYAPSLRLGLVSFSAAAKSRLEKYLWFGNLGELETVIARTLAIHRKTLIEEADLIFDTERETKIDPSLRIARNEPVETDSAIVNIELVEAETAATNGIAGTSADLVAGPFPELRLFIHELAHELKNPMVTIKTFAQLLADRYQDAAFRARYKEVVDEDIGRIDQLLEVMVEFADFGPPHKTKLELGKQVHTLVGTMGRELAKHQLTIGWQGSDGQKNIYADEAQLRYILKNLLLTALNQAKSGTPISFDLDKPGRLAIVFTGEGTRVASIPPHLGSLSPGLDTGGLPLRILLAQNLAERNNGNLKIDLTDRDTDAIVLEFPIA